jgi:hypothetical protein
MNIAISTSNGVSIAELNADKPVIFHVDDALDLIGNCGYQGADSIIVPEEALTPDFFDLKTRLAGDILQKFSNYGMRLAIVGDFSKYASKSLNDFIFESNKGKRINFVGTTDEARLVLSAK